MTFYVENEAEYAPSFDLQKIGQEVAKKVLETEKCPYDAQVNVLITDNDGIRDFNSRYRGIEKETDVLSFPNLEFEEAGVFRIDERDRADCFDPESKELVLGDIILSADRIREQAQSYGHSEKREFAFLVAHSMYHLCGYDHMTEEEADIMERKQEETLRLLGITRE